MKRGCFLTFEGVEGVGKSTNLEFVHDYLSSRLSPLGIDVVRTREPGGTPLAEEIRELLLQPREEPVSEVAELLLMFAARAQHVQTLVEPHLHAGRWVLCDRFTDATVAYQGAGRGMREEVIEQLAELAHPALVPDLTIYLDLVWSVARERIANRPHDRMEQESANFFERVRAGYLRQAEAQPRRFRVISASPPLPEVQAQIAACLDEFLERLMGVSS